MRILRPFARRSRVSIVGETSPFIILFMADFETPVMIDTWRMDKFFSYMILLSRIFMYIILNINICK